MSEFSSAYEKLKQSAQKDGLDAVSAELLNDNKIREYLDTAADGITIAQVSNLRRKLVKELRRQEDTSAADWIISQVLGNFPEAEYKIKRVGNKRVATLYLDGMGEKP